MVLAILIEIVAELAETSALISRPQETVLNFCALLVWAAAGIYVGLGIKEKPSLRYSVIAGSCLFVVSQFLNLAEDLWQASGLAINPTLKITIDLSENASRSLGWGLFFVGLYFMVLELNRARNLLAKETEELRREVGRGRALESNLRLKEDIYRSAIAQADAVPYQRDYATNTYTFLDEGIEDLTGYTAAEITPQIWEMEIVQETVLDQGHTGMPIEQVLEDIRNGNINQWKDDCRIRTKDGQTRWCTDASIQILGDDGLPVGSIGILQDITDKKLFEEELRQRIEFERLVTKISTDFIQESKEDIDQRIWNSFRSIGEFADVDRCFLFRFEDENSKAVITHEWCREGVSSLMDDWKVVPTSEFPWVSQKLLSGDVVQACGNVGFPEGAMKENETLQKMNIGSFVFVPQVLEGKTVGFVGFVGISKDRDWPEHTVALLRVVGQILAFAQGRRINEQAILASKERYRRLFEDSHDAIYMVTHEGHFVDVNPAFLWLFGYEREEIDELDGFSIFSSIAEKLRFQSEIEREGALRDYELIFKKKNGSRMDALLTASVRRDSNGEIYGYQGIIRDITEKKKAEKSFRLIVEGTSGTTGEAFFSSLVRALAGVIGVRYALVSELVQAGEGLPAKLRSLAFWSGKEFGEALSIDFQQSPFEEAIDKGLLYIPKGAAERYPGPSVLKDLQVQCYMGIRLNDASGNPIGLLSVFDGKGLDIEPRTAENLLRIFAARASAELSRIQAEDTRLEIERQMFESQKIESLGVLAGGIAHDFNNLLTSILGNVCLAEYDLDADSPLQGYLKNIERATQRAADLAQQMLAYSGRSKFIVEQLQMNDILEEVEELLAVALPKNVVFEKELAGALPCLDGDATQLRQVFMNLIINAGEAITNKGGRVHTRTRQVWLDESYTYEIVNREELAQGPYIEVRIADTGSGMDEDTRSRIFDPFFTTKFTGRGLGLAAVLGIVRGHQGGIGVESAPGKGTTFTLLIPITKHKESKKNDPEEDPTPHQGSGLVLIIDDEESVQNVAAKILIRSGYDVLTAGDGFEGLQIIQTRKDEIDLVLLDLNMPSLTGEETYQRIQSISPGQKVLIMSGYSEQEALTLFDDIGYLGFLQKPFLPEVLTKEVMQALSGSNGHHSGTSDVTKENQSV